MKLLRYGPVGQEKPGILDAAGKLRDLSGTVADIAGDTLSPAGLAKLKALDPTSLPLVSGTSRIGACVGNVGKFIAVGLNYSDHAAETGAKVPEEPILFMKATSSIVGPNDTVVIPKKSVKTDWEVELAIVIGTKANYVDEADALSHVAGYCIVNDVSEREFQAERGGQWTKGKSADTGRARHERQAGRIQRLQLGEAGRRQRIAGDVGNRAAEIAQLAGSVEHARLFLAHRPITQQLHLVSSP